jgi:hypothetical protein
MFWTTKKQPNPPTPRRDFHEKIDSAVAAAVAAKIDLRTLADALEDKAQSLRVRYAIDAPLF